MIIRIRWEYDDHTYVNLCYFPGTRNESTIIIQFHIDQIHCSNFLCYKLTCNLISNIGK